MIAGYHILFGTYGFWLPNDPRGSWSDFVGSWELYRYGPATKTTQRRSLAWDAHDNRQRIAGKKALKYPPVVFTGVQARAAIRGFADYIARAKLPVWACSILPDHIHLVIGRPHTDVEQITIQLKGNASRTLDAEGIHPLAAWRTRSGKPPKCFARGEWKVYLDAADVPRAIQYVRDNPIKENKPAKNWWFVTSP